MIEYQPETEGQFIARIFMDMKKRRKELRLTQELVARRMNKSQFYVSTRERGDTELDMADALLFAAALDMPLIGRLPKVPTAQPAKKAEPKQPAKAEPKKWSPPRPHEKKEEAPVKTAAPARPSPAVMPKKAEPAPVRVAGVARVPQVVVNTKPDVTVDLPKTFLWKEDLRVTPGANEVVMGIMAVDGDWEGSLELPIKDARALKALLALKLPHRDTEANQYTTRFLDDLNRAMGQSMAQNRRTRVMRVIQPTVMAFVTDIWREIRDVRDGATLQEEEWTRERTKLHTDVNQLREKLARRSAHDPEEAGAATIKTSTETADRIAQLQRELEQMRGETSASSKKLERLRKAMEDQDALVESLKTQLKEAEGNPSELQKQLAEVGAENDLALSILDELYELAGSMRQSGSADNKMTGMTIQMRMKEMGYEE